MAAPMKRTKDTTAPPQTPLEFLRFCWASLTSMRTAIILLFLLALAAIPGSLGPKVLPQRPSNPVMVNEFIKANPQRGAIFDKLGLFDVYGSAWFAAIYLLLMISMVGCLIPRIRHYAKAVRAMPPGTPKHLDKLAEHASGRSTLESEAALDAAQSYLTGRGYRVRRQGNEVSGERGYLRELGNLVFHVSILGILLGVLISSLFGFKGSVIVTEGSAFSNNLSQYDDFSSGALFNPDRLDPFTVYVDKFHVAFEDGPVQHGAARAFDLDGRLAVGSDAPSPVHVEVNTPLTINGEMVNLIGHGYAPVVTITDPQGHVAFSGPAVFLPQDSNFTSQGVIKAPDARPNRIGIEGYFVPTQSSARGIGPRSIFPNDDNPQLWGTIWEGPPAVETGAPDNIYALNKTGMTQVKDGAAPATFALKPGESYKLPDGSVIRFDSYKRWTKLQVSSNPGLPLVWVSVAIGVLALMLSLFVKPRRVFSRITPDADGLVVEAGGFDRANSRTGLDADVAGLVAALGASEVALEREDDPRAGDESEDGATTDDPDVASEDDPTSTDVAQGAPTTTGNATEEG